MITFSKINTTFKVLRKFISLKEPSSKNWGIVYSTVVRFLKSVLILLPELPLQDVQELSAYCKHMSYPGLNIERMTLPDQFREQAYQFLKNYAEQKYGYYPIPSNHHWNLSKPIDIQWYRVKNRANSNPKSVIYFIHGGGYGYSHSCQYNGMFKELSQVSSSEILTLEYRLGPQYTIPSMVEDVLAAYFYLLAPISQGGRGFNSSQVVVGGESAGGGLSANLIHILRSAKLSTPVGAFLWSPAVDLTLSQPSYIENNKLDYLWNMINPPIKLGNNGLTLDSGLFLWMYNQSSQEVKDRMVKDGTTLGPRDSMIWPDSSPMFDSNMDGLPPTLIIVGERETFRDFGIVYGRRRAEAEIKNQNKKTIIPNVETIVYDDMVHAFVVLPFNKFSTHGLKTTSEFIYQALNANDEQKLTSKQYSHLPDYKKAYMNTTYNMYWTSIQFKTKPWESPYKITPFSTFFNTTTPPISTIGSS